MRQEEGFVPDLEAEEHTEGSIMDADSVEAGVETEIGDGGEVDEVVMSEDTGDASTIAAKAQELIDRLLPDATQQIPHLPSPDKWKTLMPRQSGFLGSNRWFISNPDTAEKVADMLVSGRDPGSPPITVVEGYTGPGIMSRAFLRQPSVEKVVALEYNRFFAKGLQNLQQDKDSCPDPSQLAIMPRSCYEWSTYTELLNAGHLDHIPFIREMRRSKPDYSSGYFADEAWQKPSPLLFFAQLPNAVHSEQLFSQLLRAICHRLWLFRFGRVRIAFLTNEHVAKRCFADVGSRERGKITHIVNALTDVKLLLSSESFEPLDQHMYPGKISVGPSLLHTANSGPIKATRLPTSLANPDKRRMCLLVLEPKVKPLLQGDEIDVFDYVTKNLFVLRSKPINEAISLLGAGADAVVRQLNRGGHPALQDLSEGLSISPEATPNTLTFHQMVALSRLFERWPFRPQHLFDEGNLSEVTEKQLSF